MGTLEKNVKSLKSMRDEIAALLIVVQEEVRELILNDIISWFHWPLTHI